MHMLFNLQIKFTHLSMTILLYDGIKMVQPGTHIGNYCVCETS